MTTRCSLLVALASLVLLWPTVHAVAAGPATLVVSVVDQSGAAVPGATVLIRAATGTRQQVTKRDGTVEFPRIVEGDCTIEVRASGFEAFADLRHLVGPAALERVVLTVAGVQEAVTVTSDADAGITGLLTPADLAALPDDPEALARVLTDMAGPDAALIVNGFEEGRLPAKGQIAFIRLVSDPFSAQYQEGSRPRVEVTTRPGVGSWTGTGSVGQRPSSLAARNPFSSTRLVSERTSLYGWLSGPVVPRRASLTLDLQQARATESRPTLAVLPAGPTRFVVSQPSTTLWATLRSEVFVDTRSLLRIEAQASHDDQRNGGLGNVDLPERAFASQDRQHSLRLSLASDRPNDARRELRFELRDHARHVRPLTDAVAIDVQGAFRAGGAGRRGDRHVTGFTAVAQWDVRRGRDRLRYGLQGDRVAIDSTEETDYLGTFVFADLASHLAAQPTTFTRRVGPAAVALHDTRVAAYGEWERPLSPRIGLSFGERLSTQGPLGGGLRQSPRAMLRWAVGAHTTLRLNAGRFLEWIDQGLREEAARLDGTGQREFVVQQPGFPLAAAGVASSAALPPGRVVLASGLGPPSMWRTSARVEWKLPRGVALNITAAWMAGGDEARSILRNAPANGARPDPLVGNIRFVDAIGRSRIASLEVNGRGTSRNRRFESTVTWALARAMNDGDGAFAYPATPAGPAGEWGPSRRDVRQRLHATITAKLSEDWRLAAFVRHQSGPRYTITTGRDDNGDTITNDRPPGVGRNSGRGPALATIDLRLARGFTLHKAQRPAGSDPRVLRLDLVAWATNLLNRAQYGPVVGVLSSPLFGRPTSATGSRRIEIGANVSF